MSKFLLLCLLIVLPNWVQQAAAQITSDDTRFNQTSGDVSALTRMHEQFASAPEIEFKTSFAETSDLPGMDRRGTARFFVRRPNSFRVELSSNKGNYVFVSDGTTFTMYRPSAARFAQVPSSDTIMGTMYLAIGLLGTQARLIDFLWTIDYGEQVSVKALGPDTIGGKTCDRFDVQRFENHWDVWLDRATAWPCKLISRKADANDRSVQTNEFIWDAAQGSEKDMFSFVPPQNARAVRPSELE
ncbi:MAG TPA: DUF2092 domain-containing protein [Hyphomicrobium sp.]|nr:DUF2092 domain-containing protein [Hyphomicrobium sp.]